MNHKISKHLKGMLAEILARCILICKGYRLVWCNKRTPQAEVDIIVKKGNTISLVEVKFRKNREDAHRAIHPAQRKRLVCAATIIAGKYPAYDVSLDAILVFTHKPFIEHIKNAWN